MLVICANPACQQLFTTYNRKQKHCSLACRHPPLAERFWAKVDKTSSPDGCWIWTGSRDTRSGYGRFSLSPDEQHIWKQRQQIDTHRMSYILQFGSIPDGLWVLHTPPCLNRLCVRHIYAGTPQDNANDTGLLDRRARGLSHGAAKHPENWARGERHYHAKLSDADVVAIRAAPTEIRGAKTALMRQYGISQAHLWYILHNKTRL